MMAHMLARVTRIFGLSVVAAIAIACSPSLTGTDLGSTSAPDFTLVDGLSGKTVQLSAQRGQVVALTFLYTSCPDTCPLTASRFKGAQDDLGGDSSKVTFIAVSVDPDRDTPQAAQAFSSAHGLSRNWFYLVGGRAQLAPVWAAYGILSAPDQGTAGVTHSDAIYLIDKAGRERTLLHSEDLASDLAKDLKVLVTQ
jgi:protein SCO1